MHLPQVVYFDLGDLRVNQYISGLLSTLWILSRTISDTGFILGPFTLGFLSTLTRATAEIRPVLGPARTRAGTTFRGRSNFWRAADPRWVRTACKCEHTERGAGRAGALLAAQGCHMKQKSTITSRRKGKYKRNGSIIPGRGRYACVACPAPRCSTVCCV